MGFFSRIGNAVKKVAKGVSNAVKSVVKGVGKAVKTVAKGVGNAVKKVVNTVTSFFSGGKTAEQVLDDFVNASGRVNTGNQLIDSLFSDQQNLVPSYFNNKQFFRMMDKDSRLYSQLITYVLEEKFSLSPYSKTYTSNIDQFEKDYSYNNFNLPEDIFFVQGKDNIKQAQNGNYTNLLNFLCNFYKINKGFLNINETDEKIVNLIGSQITLFRAYSGEFFPLNPDYKTFPDKYLYNIYPDFKRKPVSNNNKFNTKLKPKYSNNIQSNQKKLFNPSQQIKNRYQNGLKDKKINGHAGLVHFGVKNVQSNLKSNQKFISNKFRR